MLCEAAALTLLLNADTLSGVVKILVTGEPFAQRVGMILEAEVEIAQRRQWHRFVVIPKNTFLAVHKIC